MSMTPLVWEGTSLRLLDQTRLPHEEVWRTLRDHREVAEAIRALRVRGAPAIGIAGAYGLALVAAHFDGDDADELLAALRTAAAELEATRPTAVNLAWALRRVLEAAERTATDVPTLRAAVVQEAQRIHQEDTEANRRLGAIGATLVPDGATVLTHCNTGALATGGHGTALGVVRSAVEGGKRVRVIATETRPLLQGARLTTWELLRDGIDCTLVVEGAVGHLMRRGEIDLVLVGADRIAANGDTANKIGTYGLAVLARHHGVPCYVAAPWSTFDLDIADGDAVPIEERAPEEVTTLLGHRLAPQGVSARNPAFDITPHTLIDAIITERGIARPPYVESLRALHNAAEARV